MFAVGTEWSYTSGDIFLDSSSGFSRSSVFFAFLLSGLFLPFHVSVSPNVFITCFS